MTRRVLLTCGSIALWACVAFAQGGAAEKGSLTGSWGEDNLPYLELKFDGSRGVTGTTIWRQDGRELARGPIATGTFDPESGNFRLTGEITAPDGQQRRYMIEGRLEKDVISGTFTLGEDKGDFRFVRL